MKNDDPVMISPSVFQRDFAKEAKVGIKSLSIYAFREPENNSPENTITVIGQIFANNTIKKPFCLVITFYDSDDDIIKTEASSSYGHFLVSSSIQPEAFFDGFPFKFHVYGLRWDEVSRVELSVEE